MNSTDVDLSELAIDREPATAGRVQLRGKLHLLTRYLIPGILIFGFLAILIWAARDLVFPPRDVSVMPVMSTQQQVRASGTPLFNAAGWIEPRPTPIRVPGLAPGIVETLMVVEDQWVNAGDPVAELVKDDARLSWEMALADQKLQAAELDHARAALTAAETRISQPVHLEAQLAEAEADLATINTELTNLPFELERAKSRLDFALNDYERNLQARDSVSLREVEDAKTLVATMQAMVDELENRDGSIRAEIRAITMRCQALREQLELLVDEKQARDQAIAQVTMAEARLEQRTVAVAEAKLRLDRMTVRAPVDGRVLLLVGHPGTRIGGRNMSADMNVDANTVVTMYKPDQLQVKVDVRFEDLPKVLLGQPVRIDNPALEEPLSGSVLFISSEADIQKNTLEVKVAIENPPAVFKPEMLVDVTFLAPEVRESEKATSTEWKIYIPARLVLTNDSGASVWIADRARGIVRNVPVQTGMPGPNNTIEIASGLDVTSRVVTSPVAELREGLRVRISEAPVNE